MGQMRIARMIRAGLAIAGAALVGFHGWLFAAQVAAGRLEDPWLVFRWIAAVTLIAALVAVRRGGESILGRKSIAIWVLAALLHGPALASDLQADFNSIAPETVVTTVLQLVSSAALAVSLWLLAGWLVQRRRSAPIRYATAPAFAVAGGRAPRSLRQFSPRPPPLRS
jgi:hypothetical protein